MNITITLSEEDQLLQAEILRVLLKGEVKEKAKDTQPTPKPTEQPTPKPYPMAGKAATPSDSSDSSDPSDTTPKSGETLKPAEQPAPEAPSLSMADLRKSVNAISRKKGLNWLYSWLGDLGVKSIADIPVSRIEEAHNKLQNYA